MLFYLVYDLEIPGEDGIHIVESNNLNLHGHQLNVDKFSNHESVVDYE
jgi:hypothetical protein